MLRPGRNRGRGGAGFGAGCREGQDPHDVQLWPVAALLLPPPLTPSTLYLPPHFTLTLPPCPLPPLTCRLCLCGCSPPPLHLAPQPARPFIVILEAG